MTRVLDRLPEFDQRSRDFPIRTLVGAAPVRSKAWRCTPRLDQGQEGACVGFGWAHEAAADPVRRPADARLAKRIYDQARHVDAWPGEDYSGTSVIAGAKVMQSFGLLREYRWAFGVDDVLATLAGHGPVVLGLPWLDSMFNTDARGRLDCSGNVAGGHCILARGLRVTRGEALVVLRNSWGRDWGTAGDALILAADLERLLNDGGEACVPVSR